MEALLFSLSPLKTISFIRNRTFSCSLSSHCLSRSLISFYENTAHFEIPAPRARRKSIVVNMPHFLNLQNMMKCDCSKQTAKKKTRYENRTKRKKTNPNWQTTRSSSSPRCIKATIPPFTHSRIYLFFFFYFDDCF